MVADTVDPRDPERLPHRLGIPDQVAPGLDIERKQRLLHDERKVRCIGINFPYGLIRWEQEGRSYTMPHGQLLLI
jgi:hypothetical protein